MICRNHVDVSEGVRRCGRCGATFCRDCLVEISGRPYCATCKTEQLLDVRSGVQADVLDLAPISRRFWAYLLDIVILYFFSTAIGFVFGLLAARGGASAALTCVSALLNILITVSYNAILVAARGQTVGKAALKIKVVSETGADATTGQAWGRAFADLIPFSKVVALFNDKHKGIHDMLAHTRVVRSESLLMMADSTARLQIQPYEGPSCPRCGARLTADWIRTGIVRCPDCNGDFEATAFKPQPRELHVEHVLATGPIEANACANHAKNAAVTACQRCGLLICALCDMNVGAGSYCPACFDRLRSENALQGAATRYRDYASMARISVIAGFLLMFLGALFGSAALYYASKGFKQLRAEGRSIVGLVIVVVFAVLEILGGLAMIVLVIYGLAKGTK